MTVHADVARIARQVRDAFEASDRSQWPLCVQDFPGGACFRASLVLGSLLKDAGLGNFKRVSGERGRVADNSWKTHAWLARQGLIVDITADQFADATGRRVIVARRSKWHSTFKITEVGPGDCRLGGNEFDRFVFEKIKASI